MFAPYNDIGEYPVPDLVALSTSYGWKAATAAFIQADTNGDPSWAGMPVLNQTACLPLPPSWASCSTQAGWVYTNLLSYINSGGKLIISFGGLSGTSLAQYQYQKIKLKYLITDAASALATQYESIISTFAGLSGLDFDIEGAAQTDGSLQVLLLALRTVRTNHPNLPISFTLPVLPTGLTEALPIVQALVDESLKLRLPVLVDVYNLMVMDFGTGNWTGSMGELSVLALTSSYSQIAEIYTKASKTFSYSNLGCTPMIGVNDVAPEIFTIEDMNLILAFADKNTLGLLAFWDGQRDVQDPDSFGEITWKPVNNSNSGTSNATGAYSQVFNNFLNDPVECWIQLKGIPAGVNVSILVGFEEYIFSNNLKPLSKLLYPATYTVFPPAIIISNMIYTANPLTITVPNNSSLSTPISISYQGLQAETLCLAISSTPFQGSSIQQWPTITVGSISFAFTSLDTSVCNLIPDNSYTITAPSIVDGTNLYTSKPLQVLAPNNSSSSDPIEIIYNKGPMPSSCSLTVTSGTQWGGPTIFSDSVTFSINYIGAKTIEMPWNFTIFNNGFISSTAWGSASKCTIITGGLQYEGNVSISNNQTITIGGTLKSTEGFIPTSATLANISCTISSQLS